MTVLAVAAAGAGLVDGDRPALDPLFVIIEFRISKRI